MISNLEPNQVILEEKLLHFILMKIRKKWISIPMILLSIMRTVYRDEYLGYFLKMKCCYSGRFRFLTADRKSNQFEKCQCAGHENIFIEEGAKLEFVTLNATSGPIYIGKDAEIMEGSVIRPFALCEGAVVKMAAKIYGATTVGPHSE
jgi:hypothetical protein